MHQCLATAEDSTPSIPNASEDTPVSPTTTTEQTPSTSGETSSMGIGGQTVEQILAKPSSLTFRDVKVHELLRTLSKQGLNIVATKEVSGELTFQLENVTLGDVLEIALITNNLAKEIKGNIIRVMTEGQYEALYGKKYNTRLVAKTYQLKNTVPTGRITRFLENIRSKTLGSIFQDDATRILLVIDVPDKIKEIEEIIKRLDVPVDTQTFELKNAKIDDIVTEVNKLLTKDFGEIRVDRRMGRFIVTDHPQVLENITYLLYQFDAKPREVLIEARMIQIALTDEFSMGINWQQAFSKYSAFKDVKLVGNFPIRGDTGQKTNLTTTVGTLPATHYEYVLKALKSFGDNKLISAPRLITLSDKKAEFHIGHIIKYPSSTQTTASSGGATTSTEVMQEIKEGVELNVTPSVNADGYITMEIIPKITKVVEWGTSGLGNPYPKLVEEATSNTNVMVKDGVTIVIAGLIKDEKTKETGGIPVLSQIPIIGSLFSSKRDYLVKAETVIFLTPYIVTGDRDSSVISKQADLERKEPKELKPVK